MDNNIGGAVQGRMTARLRESMVVQILSSSELLHEALQLIQPSHFNGPDEVGLAMLWRAITAVMEQHGQLSYALIADTMEMLVSDDPVGLTDIEMADILSDDPEHPGLLYHALHVVQPGQFPVDHGRALVRRFLEERTVADALRDVIDATQGGTPADIGTLLRELTQRRERIHSININPVSAGVDDDWTDDPVEQFPLDIPFLDLYMDGGNICGEAHGLLGPSGVGKTTLSCQMVISAAKYFAKIHRETGEHRLAYFFSYEQPRGQIRKKLVANAAVISWSTLKNLNNPQTELSRTGNLKPYEMRLFAGQEAPIRGEYERYLDAKPILQDYVRIVDMSGNGENSRPGHGYVDEIASILATDTIRNPAIRVGWVVCDYVGLIAWRYLQAKSGGRPKNDDMLRHYIGQFGDEFKQQVCLQYNIPGWILHQFNTQANKKSPIALLTHNDAAESGAFAHNLAYCFCLGTKDPQTNCVRLNCSKRRHAGTPIDPPLLHIEGEYSRLVDGSGAYMIDSNRNQILPRAMREQFAGEAATSRSFRSSRQREAHADLAEGIGMTTTGELL